MNYKLLPCPFCGGNAILVPVDGYRPSDPKTYEIVCAEEKGDCPVHSSEFDTIDEAVAWWNRRPGAWQPLRADDPYLDDSPVWVDENGCVCWHGPDGVQRLVLHGDMQLCLFVPGEEQKS